MSVSVGDRVRVRTLRDRGFSSSEIAEHTRLSQDVVISVLVDLQNETEVFRERDRVLSEREDLAE